ncbi:hypothetical protein [Saccharothrix sp. HUAS TT1]|uniref:hypothetical protein n=1 Tax=unclassified Saccharothrix TaxID=2593673 RepID=UPI00345BBFD0
MKDEAGAPDLQPPLPPSVTADGPVQGVREPGGYLPRPTAALRLLHPLVPARPRASPGRDNGTFTQSAERRPGS